MHLQTLALFSILAVSAVAALETPQETCNAGVSCNAGYCCSRSGFCGKSTIHCSVRSGCDSSRGDCGLVVLDKNDLPQVIPYNDMSIENVQTLLKTLQADGSKVSASMDELHTQTSLEGAVMEALAEKTMLPQQANGSNITTVPMVTPGSNGKIAIQNNAVSFKADQIAQGLLSVVVCVAALAFLA